MNDQAQAIARAYTAGLLERIKVQPIPAAETLFSRLVVWQFGWLMFLRLEAKPLKPALGSPVAFALMAGYVTTEDLAAYLDQPRCWGRPSSATVWT